MMQRTSWLLTRGFSASTMLLPLQSHKHERPVTERRERLLELHHANHQLQTGTESMRGQCAAAARSPHSCRARGGPSGCFASGACGFALWSATSQAHRELVNTCKLRVRAWVPSPSGIEFVHNAQLAAPCTRQMAATSRDHSKRTRAHCFRTTHSQQVCSSRHRCWIAQRKAAQHRGYGERRTSTRPAPARTAIAEPLFDSD